MSNFDTNLDKNSANFVPLSPLSFITRVKDIYPNYDSLVYGKRSYTWLETYNRCTKFASALEKKGITKGSTVSNMSSSMSMDIITKKHGCNYYSSKVVSKRIRI